jgi:hypothetical protein
MEGDVHHGDAGGAACGAASDDACARIDGANVLAGIGQGADPARGSGHLLERGLRTTVERPLLFGVEAGPTNVVPGAGQ